MITIVASDVRISRLLGRQVIKTNNTQYRWMKYILRAKSADGLLLYNVITGHLVMLNEKEAKTADDLQIIGVEYQRNLIENYFIVPFGFDEKGIVLKLRNLMNRLFTAEGISHFTILTTTNCNARCFYCYEKELTRMDMEEGTAHNVIDFITRRKCPGSIELNWFGGEPLVCIQRIDQISSELNSVAVDFTSSMTSNGYLFNPEVVSKAFDLWHLRHIQITLDGREDTYNRIKAYVVDDVNPYMRVLDNIELLLRAGIHVSIRLNFDRFNLGDIKELVNDLGDRFGQYKNVSVYAHFILPQSRRKLGRYSDPEEDELLREQFTIMQQIKDLGLNHSELILPKIRSRSCTADSKDTIVIYPNGHLYKCIDITEEDQVGDIWHPKLDESVLWKYQDRIELRECGDCPLFPSCILLRMCPDISKQIHLNCEHKLCYSITAMKQKAFCSLHSVDN